MDSAVYALIVNACIAGLFATAETRALKTETAIDALRAKFGAAAVVAGRALKKPG